MNQAGESVTSGAVRSESVIGKTVHGEMLNPAAVFASGVGGAWFTAYDNTYLKVNSDGTGGAVASGGTIGRWDDRSGNGNHVEQATANLRPIFRNGDGVNFFHATNTTTRLAYLRNNSTDAIPRDNCSGGVSCWLPGATATSILDLGTSQFALLAGSSGGDTTNGRFFRHYTNDASFVNTTAVYSARKMVVTWRSNGSNLIIRVNGSEYSTTARTSASMTRIIMGMFSGGGGEQIRMFEAVVFDEDIGADSLASLEVYLRANAGTYDANSTVAIVGDSLSGGAGSESLIPWHDPAYVSNRPNSLWYSFSCDGGLLVVPQISAANLASLKGSTEGVVILWIGTNDINLSVRTGLQTAASLKAYSDTLRAAGCKVVVCTLQDFPNNEAERLACNAQIATDSASYDAIVDLAAAAELDDCTDTTYFTSDQVHLKDTGYAVVGGLIQTAMAGL